MPDGYKRHAIVLLFFLSFFPCFFMKLRVAIKRAFYYGLRARPGTSFALHNNFELLKMKFLFHNQSV